MWVVLRALLNNCLVEWAIVLNSHIRIYFMIIFILVHMFLFTLQVQMFVEIILTILWKHLWAQILPQVYSSFSHFMFPGVKELVQWGFYEIFELVHNSIICFFLPANLYWIRLRLLQNNLYKAVKCLKKFYIWENFKFSVQCSILAFFFHLWNINF